MPTNIQNTQPNSKKSYWPVWLLAALAILFIVIIIILRGLCTDVWYNRWLGLNDRWCSSLNAQNLEDGSVTTSKIADGALTIQKLSPSLQQSLLDTGQTLEDLAQLLSNLPSGPQGMQGIAGATGPAGTSEVSISSLSNTSLANTLSTTVNGVTGATVPIINTNALSLVGNSLTSTINGLASNSQDLSTIQPTTCSAASAYFCQDGNSFGATAVLGTNDANSLTFETSNLAQATIAVGGATTFQNSADSTGAFSVLNAAGTTTVFDADTVNSRVGIGIATPGETLHVVGTSKTTGHAAIGANANVNNTSDILYPAYSFSTVLNVSEQITDLTSTILVGGIANHILLSPAADTTAYFSTLNNEVFTDPAIAFNYGGDIFGIDNIVKHQGSGAISGNAYGGYNQVSNSGAGSINDAYGSASFVFNDGTGSATSMTGARGFVINSGSTSTSSLIVGVAGSTVNSNSTTVTLSYGGFFDAQNTGAGTLTSADGIFANIENSSTGTITTARNIDIKTTNSNASGTIGDLYGIVINIPSNSGTINNNYALRIEDQSSVGSTNSYNIYSDGSTAKNYFAGLVGIGIPVPTAKLHVEQTANSTGFQVDSGVTTANAAVINANSLTTGTGLHISNTTSHATADNLLILQGGNDGAAETGTHIQFRRPDGTVIGSINQDTATTVAYNLTSDQRLKENIADTHYSLDTILNIKVHDYNYIADPSQQQLTGFLAQQLYAQYPQAVTIGTDEVDVNGVLVHPWQVDYSKLTPLLTKGIQDLNAKVDSVSARVAALEAGNGTSVDVLKALADAKAVTLNGDLNVGGGFTVAGHVEVGGDTAGTAKLVAGSSKVHVSFTSQYKVPPKVTVTPHGANRVDYGTENVTVAGFDIVIDPAQTKDLLFDWTALQ